MKLHCLCLIFFISLQIDSSLGVCKLGVWYTVRDQVSGYVIDAVDHEVIFAYYTGSLPQLWYFICAAAPGIFTIPNVYALGYSLEASKNGTLFLGLTNIENVFQQWFVNSDGSLFNVGLNGKIGGDVIEESGLQIDDLNPISFILQEKV